jgi:hypothetical protein
MSLELPFPLCRDVPVAENSSDWAVTPSLIYPNSVLSRMVHAVSGFRTIGWSFTPDSFQLLSDLTPIFSSLWIAVIELLSYFLCAINGELDHPVSILGAFV